MLVKLLSDHSCTCSLCLHRTRRNI